MDSAYLNLELITWGIFGDRLEQIGIWEKMCCWKVD